MFSPKKFSAAAIATIGGDLWGYLEGGQAHADYYLGAGGTPTSGRVELHGGLLERLGVSSLDCEVFERLAAGCHPVSGERLVQTSHVPTALIDPGSGRPIVQGGFHVPGIDCNLSPPKSVSALLPFLPAEGRAELEAAHLAAVRATLHELEAQVPLCRPTVNGQQVHAPGELGIAVFTHHTSRPSPEVAAHPGRPPDPQLHSHAFVFNLAWCQGRFLAIDSKPLLRFASTAEAIYTASWPPSSSSSATGCGGSRPAAARSSSWTASTRASRSCSQAATATSNSSPTSSRRPVAARRRLSSGATWPPATAPRRPMPATRPTGPPTARSSATSAFPSQFHTTTGNGPRRCRCPSGKPRYEPGSWAPMGSLATTPPSTRPLRSRWCSRLPPACSTPKRHAGSWNASSPASI